MSDDDDRVIQVIGLIDGSPSAFDGQFVVSFDPGQNGVEPGTGRPMMARLETTPDIDKATRFRSEDAFELWRSVDPRNPVRGDGKPNRPFTAFSIAVSRPEDVML